MIAGTIILEDFVINFHSDFKNNCDSIVRYSVTDNVSQTTEFLVCDGSSFFKALSIAVHPNGGSEAEYSDDETTVLERDYREAEAIQKEIRWIP